MRWFASRFRLPQPACCTCRERAARSADGCVIVRADERAGQVCFLAEVRDGARRRAAHARVGEAQRAIGAARREPSVRAVLHVSKCKVPRGGVGRVGVDDHQVRDWDAGRQLEAEPPAVAGPRKFGHWDFGTAARRKEGSVGLEDHDFAPTKAGVEQRVHRGVVARAIVAVPHVAEGSLHLPSSSPPSALTSGSAAHSSSMTYCGGGDERRRKRQRRRRKRRRRGPSWQRASTPCSNGPHALADTRLVNVLVKAGARLVKLREVGLPGA